MDSIGKTKFSVCVLGSVTASLMLWLSASFWFDAWRQREDARWLDRAAMLESALLTSAREVAHERTVAIALLGGSGIDTRELDVASMETLEEHRAKLDARLDTTMLAVAAMIDDLASSGRLRHSSAALKVSLTALDKAHDALSSQRRQNTRVLTGEARSRAMRETFALTNRLIERLHGLQDGLYVEPRVNVPRITDLRRLKVDLRDFDEAVSRAAALPRMSRVDGGWELNLTAAMTKVATRLEKLRLHERDRTIEPGMLARLDAIVEVHERSITEQGGRAELIRGTAALDTEIERALVAEIDELEAHAWRRLVIDTALIAVCFWIAYVSAGLLGNIQHQAWHDRLTGLPNRFRLMTLLDDILESPRAREGALAVLVFDIDDFKSVNDNVGHAGGDVLLRQFAERLVVSAEPRCTFAALGADQFAAILTSVRHRDEAQAMAERLQAIAATPFMIDGLPVRVTLSLGIAFSDTGIDSAAELLKRADVAIRQAKGDGQGRVRLFDLALAKRNEERLSLHNDLRDAVHEGQLEIHYQPKVNTRTARIDGLEALVRWRHPERGLVPPGVFIPIAERGDLIGEIGAWVLDEAVRQTASWHRDGLDGLQIAVNVSAEQLFGDDFVDEVTRTLRRHALPAARLELEVTESVGMNDMACVVDQLQRLRTLGVSIAIDDFGTEYSSLQYLEALPVDNLKIDRAFIERLDGSKGRSLARTIVLMADSLDLGTVAEGVETHEQLQHVVALGCDHVQGYYYSPPVPAADTPATIARIEADLAVDRVGGRAA